MSLPWTVIYTSALILTSKSSLPYYVLSLDHGVMSGSQHGNLGWNGWQRSHGEDLGHRAGLLHPQFPRSHGHRVCPCLPSGKLEPIPWHPLPFMKCILIPLKLILYFCSSWTFYTYTYTIIRLERYISFSLRRPFVGGRSWLISSG